ncbi:DUF6318 family protein [Aeromicrobium sp.]|uniref:DUF6318 family protein n=1 Tax=Aeromicrobium sp. TaxID=1871063 RepID=UPI0039E57846
MTVVAVVVVVAGCAAEPRPIEPEASASASATLAVPVVPVAAGENTPEGAEAFLHYYIEVINYASHTGDTGPLQQASTPDCTGCQDYVNHFNEWDARGGSTTDGDWSISEIEQVPHATDAAWVVTLHLAAGFYIESKGAERKRFEASDEEVTFVARFTNGGWQMAQLLAGRQL